MLALPARCLAIRTGDTISYPNVAVVSLSSSWATRVGDGDASPPIVWVRRIYYRYAPHSEMYDGERISFICRLVSTGRQGESAHLQNPSICQPAAVRPLRPEMSWRLTEIVFCNQFTNLPAGMVLWEGYAWSKEVYPFFNRGLCSKL